MFRDQTAIYGFMDADEELGNYWTSSVRFVVAFPSMKHLPCLLITRYFGRAGWNGYEDRDWCETADPTCRGAFADARYGSLAQLGSDYCDQSQVHGDTSESCQYSNDGACDEGTYCTIGTDSTDCAGLCMTSTLDLVNAACPASGRGLVPSTCDTACAAAFVPWWARCFSEASVHVLDTSNQGQLSAFNLLCGGSAMGSPDTFQSPQFSIVSGPCTLESGGRCVGRPAGYSDSETCQISSTKTARLEACPIFNTESGCAHTGPALQTFLPFVPSLPLSLPIDSPTSLD